ncbi:MAG TPA: hypothetical protein PLB12_10825 [Candidatus Goldiibacteriota bacterium]|nr:hypothetical protein [Candidatus Goldiibacteriota bacterium]
MKTTSSMLKNVGDNYKYTISDAADIGGIEKLSELGIPGEKERKAK